MANRSRLAPAALLALLLAPPAQADWKFSSDISVSETFTDNAGLRTREFAHSQWITEISPGFRVLHNGPRLKLNGSYQYNYFAYSGDARGNRTNQQLYNATAQGIVVDDLLYFDASAGRAPRSLSAFGPQLNDNPYARNNSSEVSTWRVSPYLRHRFGASANLVARYARDSVDAGIGAPGSSDADSANLQLTSGSLFNTLGWGLSYNRQYITTESAGDSSSENAGLNLSYRLRRTLSLTASGGYDRYEYESIGGGRTEGNNWSAGFDWTPSPRTRVQLAGGRHFYGNTWDLAATHRSRRSVWSLTYNDEIVNSRDQFLRPIAADTAAMIDAMFRASIPDPMERRDAVAAYMAANGLGPTFGDSLNYFSNRFLRQKGFNLSVVFRGPRASLALGANDTTRTVLSGAGSDTSTSPELERFNDNVQQRGVSAVASYRITPRSIAQAGLTLGRSRSLTTGIVNNNQALRVGLTRQLGNRVSGALEARHVRGSAEITNGRKYHENAISATITMQYSAR